MAQSPYEVIREGEEIILRVHLEHSALAPTIEDDAKTMALVISYIQEVRVLTKLVISQNRDYEYDYDQTQQLVELANAISTITSHKLLYPETQHSQLNALTTKTLNSQYVNIQNIVMRDLKSDPFLAYVSFKRLLRHTQMKLKELYDDQLQKATEEFLQVVTYIVETLEKTKLIRVAQQYLAGYSKDNRDLYRQFLTPTIRPDFMLTRLMASYPKNAKEIDSFMIKDTEVTIFQLEDNIQYLYHIMPPEFRLSDDLYSLLDEARTILSEHKPQREEFTDPERIREVFANVGFDLLQELSKKRNLSLRKKELDMLTQILVRYTVGFGLIEVLLDDEQMQDISVNSPQGSTPIYIVHGKYDECVTNILPTKGEAESWATKLRLMSGRSLDEADPILDTELEFQTASVRVSAITYPLDPTGLAFSFRRHRNEPWTLPLFVKYKMINPLAAGLISFLIDGSRAILIAGTRSSGKSSFLSSIMVEIMRRYRMITIEDSVSGDSVVQILENNSIRRCSISTLFEYLAKKYTVRVENGREIIDLTNIKVQSYIEEVATYVLTNALVRHKVEKQMYEVITKTGRRLCVTEDHSLFKLSNDLSDVLEEVSTRNLHIGDRIAVPKKIKGLNRTQNFFSFFDSLRTKNVSLYCKIANTSVLKKHQKISGVIPVQKCVELREKPLKIKVGKNSVFWLPSQIELSEDLLTALGLWLADGRYDKNSIIFSVSSVEEKNLVKRVAKVFSLKAVYHSDKFSLMIHSKSLKTCFEKAFELGGSAYSKRIPSWIFSLSLKQKACFLRGFFSGDGHVSQNEIICSLSNLGLLDDIQSLLLEFGIILRINRLRKRKTKNNDRTKDGRISDLDSIILYKKHIGFLQKYKSENLQKFNLKKSTHQTSGGVKLSQNILLQLQKICPRKIFNSQDYLVRKNSIGIRKLTQIATFLESKNTSLHKYLVKIIQSSIYWDEIVSLKKLPLQKEYVYDFSVEQTGNFVANNIIAHNTLELPTKQLRKLGFNIQPMKVASALGAKSNEMDASDGIRATLRLGDSALFVGEVRSKEAKALYEAMRVGAAANVVAGTIHGDSPYGIFDRVVNDIGVPKTSFKATDIIIIANPIRSADGLHKYRRVLSVTEVRKDWENDPLSEKGFVELLKYNPQTDQLEPTDALIGGDSDSLKDIAGKIKEFAGNWDAVWNNILLRGKMKEELVRQSELAHIPQLLEAKFVISCNDEFHRLYEILRKDKTIQSENEFNEKLFYEWKSWLLREIRKVKATLDETTDS